ncbi:hypothetical protein CHARACLAT_001296 [Characodon lateralis]|uniref:C-type lectin domain-containing protein n=1 Tax=Characodon lateralis TaxID=208331 RepID=A0ABU7CJI8_9TELE|nr:hypothetical protein [Characodon lateralis]
MEEIYINVQPAKPACQIPAFENRGLSNYKKRASVGIIIFLGILNVLLLAGLITLHVYSSKLAADLSNINKNLTEHLKDCNNKLSSMIEERDLLNANLTEMTKKLNGPRGTCPTGWRTFNYSCYFLSTTKGSWDEGRKDCRTRGADLVVINNKNEQTFLSTFAERHIWIGLNDKETEGSWKWVDATPITLAFWANNQPDNGLGDPEWGEENCVHIKTQESSLWNDLSCSTSLLWICEKLPLFTA